jgi:hypothetical protein
MPCCVGQADPWLLVLVFLPFNLPDCLPPTLAACPAEDGKLEQVVRDTARVAAEQIKGLSTQVGAADAWCNKGVASKSCVSSH